MQIRARRLFGVYAGVIFVDLWGKKQLGSFGMSRYEWWLYTYIILDYISYANFYL